MYMKFMYYKLKLYDKRKMIAQQAKIDYLVFRANHSTAWAYAWCAVDVIVPCAIAYIVTKLASMALGCAYLWQIMW